MTFRKPAGPDARQPRRLFALLAPIFGLLYLALTPAFQVPDEINHFYRAWQLSEGTFLPEQRTNRLGGQLPVGLSNFSAHFEPLIAHPERKLTKSEWHRALEYQIGTERTWYDFPNTAFYSPLNYLPQAAGIALARIFTDAVAPCFWAGRVASLAFWTACLWLCLSITPVYRWLIVVLALLPMSLYINASLSADVVVNAVSFLYLAFILHLTSRPSGSKRITTVILLLAAALLPMLKAVYTPLLLLVLIIPRVHLGTKTRQVTILMTMAIVALMSFLIQQRQLEKFYLSNQEYAPEAGWVHLAPKADARAQKNFVAENPLQVAMLLSKSVTREFARYSPGFIAHFGWLETKLPNWCVVLAYLLLGYTALFDPTRIWLNGWQKAWMLLVGVFLMGSIALSQYLLWTPVGDYLVTNLQGRYFIPVFPLLFMALGLPRQTWRHSWPAFWFLEPVLLLTGGLVLIILRYWI